MPTRTIVKQDELALQKLLFADTSNFSKVLTLSLENTFPINAYGNCKQCVCPGFQGSSYECTRGGCQHHYDEHN